MGIKEMIFDGPIFGGTKENITDKEPVDAKIITFLGGERLIILGDKYYVEQDIPQIVLETLGIETVTHIQVEDIANMTGKLVNAKIIEFILGGKSLIILGGKYYVEMNFPKDVLEKLGIK